MKPVNLLPASERRRTESAKRIENSSFVVLGILGVLLLAALYFVSTSNSINSDKSAIAKANQETAAAKARAAQLGPFAEFAKIKQTRENSVKTLATQRFDWERLMREIGLVLPEGTAIQNLTAATSGDPASAGGSSSSTSTPAPSTGTASDTSAPSMDLKGCAKHQDDVATMMVRLRALHRVADVTLNDSEEPSPAGNAGGGAQTSGASDSTGVAQCKTYQFEVTVTFTADDTSGQKPSGRKVPSRLGGGA